MEIPEKFGRYDIKTKLPGGMAAVYLALERRFECEVNEDFVNWFDSLATPAISMFLLDSMVIDCKANEAAVPTLVAEPGKY